MDNAGFRFLGLPIELQLAVIELVRNSSDLHALCLVSKELSDITKPYLYHRVNIKITSDFKAKIMRRIGGKEEEQLITKKISALLLEPANLRLVRVLETSSLGIEPSKLMDRLLPQLQKDSLIKLNYSTRSPKFFPTLPQMQLLWSTQRRLQNLKLSTHMVHSLKQFVKRWKPGQCPLLNSFTELDINSSDADRSTMVWPLKNLKLCLLQSLTIHALNAPPDLLPNLQASFADGSFVNLTRLSLQFILNFPLLTLTNVPSLESLDIYHCGPIGQSNLQLTVADNFPLKHLSFSDNGNVDKLIPILARVKGLESLVIKLDGSIAATTASQSVKACARAVVAHKETLRLFKLKVHLRSNFPPLLWDAYAVREIQLCKKIVKLSLTVTATEPIYYRDLIASFPNLSRLTIYKGISVWSAERALKIFPASTKLESVVFKNYGHPSNNRKWNRQRFVRKELERIRNTSFQPQQSEKDSGSTKVVGL